MQWSGGEYAGFSTLGATSTWLPLNDDWRRLNVEAQMGDDGSMLSLYRELLWLRSSSPALQSGTYRPVDAGEGVFGYLREAGDERFAIAINFTDQELEIDLGDLGTGRVAAGTHGSGTEVEMESLALEPHEAVVVELETSQA